MVLLRGVNHPQRKCHQLDKGVNFTVDLSKPLGITFDAMLKATKVQKGSQAEKIGIRGGFRAQSIGGAAVETEAELMTKSKSLQNEGVTQAIIAFMPLPIAITFDERPLGIVIGRDSESGLIAVSEVMEPALSKGVRPGAVLVRIEGQDVGSISEDEVAELLRNATFPVTLFFEQVYSSKAKGKFAVAQEFVYDLSKPLGIHFDAKLVAKEVQDGSQSAAAGVRKNWHVISIGEKSVQTDQELTAAEEALKAQGKKQVTITFVEPATSSSVDSSANLKETVVPNLPEPVQTPMQAVKRADGENKKIVFLKLMGIKFDAKLVAREVIDGSQSAKAGVCNGWQALSVGEQSVQTIEELESAKKALEAQGKKQVTITFLEPATPPSADCTNHRETVVPHLSEPAQMPLQTTKKARFDDSESKKIGSEGKQIVFDLAKTWGFCFDAKLVTKEVQDGSQAAEAGVSSGWQVLSIGEQSVQTKKELFAEIRALKEQCKEQVVIRFAELAPNPSADSSASSDSGRKRRHSRILTFDAKKKRFATMGS